MVLVMLLVMMVMLVVLVEVDVGALLLTSGTFWDKRSQMVCVLTS
jgi:hypothetical protein